MPIAKKASVYNLIANIFLFIIKLIAGIASNSIAVISDAINSFDDIITSIAVLICVRISRKKANEGHPFGYHRAEPIAGLIVAIFIGIVGFEVIRNAIRRLFFQESIEITSITIIIIIISIIIKGLMYEYSKKVAAATHSPAIKTTADIIISFLASIEVALIAGL
jgi:cation diffusion facilitator family transporter